MKYIVCEFLFSELLSRTRGGQISDKLSLMKVKENRDYLIDFRHWFSSGDSKSRSYLGKTTFALDLIQGTIQKHLRVLESLIALLINYIKTYINTPEYLRLPALYTTYRIILLRIWHRILWRKWKHNIPKFTNGGHLSCCKS